MTTATIERGLKPLELPFESGLMKWLYAHLPPRVIRSKKMHKHYSQAIGLLLEALESDGISAADRRAIGEYLELAVPSVEKFEKKAFPIGDVSAEQMLRFLMEQNNLSQYDLAGDLGGQPVVSEILNGKRKLTREHIERLSARFHVSPATFFRRCISAIRASSP